MKKINPSLSLLSFCAILIFSCSNCKPKGKGKLILKLESQMEKLSIENGKQIEKIYRSRLISFGMEEEDFSIRTNQAENIIEVEISGISNYPADVSRRISKLLQADAHLSFWETFSNQEILPVLDKIYGTDSLKRIQWNHLFQGMGWEQAQYLPATCVLGLVKTKDTAKVNFILDSLFSLDKFPHFLRFMWTSEPDQSNPQCYGLICLKCLPTGKASIDKPVLTKVRSQDSEYGMGPEISMKMDDPTALVWSRLTKANIGRQIAIVLDGMVYTYPTVQSEITGGVSTITGNFTKDEVQVLVSILQIEALPCPMRIVQSNLVP